jgi:transposase-like protein
VPPELLSMVIHTLMGAEADAPRGAGYGELRTERTKQRNGEFDTRVGTLDMAIRSCGTVPISRTGCCKGASALSGQ